MTLTYFVQASWEPAYDFHLTRADGALRIERGALISQASGEDWRDVTLTLSTAPLSGQTEPSELFPMLRRIEDKQAKAAVRSLSAPMMESPVIVEEADMGPSVDFDGLVAAYAFSQPVTVANNADLLRLSFDTLGLEADVYAAAVPSRDATAFVMGAFTNDLGEPLLPSDTVTLFLDGRLAGTTWMDEPLPVGAAAKLPFGAIDGLRLKQIVKDRNAGAGGVFTRSNEQSEQVTLVIDNLTGTDWPVQVFHAVPYSEQEDLEISWTAAPPPVTDSDDDRRGILRWELDVAAGTETRIDIGTSMSWPEDKVLR